MKNYKEKVQKAIKEFKTKGVDERAILLLLEAMLDWGVKAIRDIEYLEIHIKELESFLERLAPEILYKKK